MVEEGIAVEWILLLVVVLLDSCRKINDFKFMDFNVPSSPTEYNKRSSTLKGDVVDDSVGDNL
jgi:hypothetical protein